MKGIVRRHDKVALDIINGHEEVFKLNFTDEKLTFYDALIRPIAVNNFYISEEFS